MRDQYIGDEKRNKGIISLWCIFFCLLFGGCGRLVLCFPGASSRKEKLEAENGLMGEEWDFVLASS